MFAIKVSATRANDSLRHGQKIFEAIFLAQRTLHNNIADWYRETKTAKKKLNTAKEQGVTRARNPEPLQKTTPKQTHTPLPAKQDGNTVG